jgi:erythronate-4-phosphate dehydrogenase
LLDVWENEPVIDTELLEMVDIGTPHIAGYSLDGKITGLIMVYKAVCEHFGLSPKFGIEDFLPEPAVRQLRVELSIDNEQYVLANAVRKVYDIREDDAKLRLITEKPEDKRGEYFDGLRKSYPVRREFQNTKVFVEDRNSKLAKKLGGIGFVTSEK